MVMWFSILLAALLFGVLHLPAVATLTPLTSLLVARTVLLNAFGGVVFGWLYWRRSLEAGMVAHATAHIGMSLTLLVAALL
jgi:membrane protease YdiL (CAAX protease family)